MRGEKIGRRGERDQAQTNAHRNGAQRHQAEFDLVARKAARSEAARADADRQKRPKQPDVKLVQLQQFFAEKKQIDLHERAEKPKKGNADHREPKRALARVNDAGRRRSRRKD